jgi:hypothetical protein
METAKVTREHVDDPAAVAARDRRQARLYCDTKQTDLILNEPALQWQPAPGLARQQLNRLLDALTLPTVTLGIVAHRGADSFGEIRFRARRRARRRAADRCRFSRARRIAGRDGPESGVVSLGGETLAERCARRVGTDRLLWAGLGATSLVALGSAAAQLIGHGLFHGSVSALEPASGDVPFGLGSISTATAALAAWTVFVRVRPITTSTIVLPPLLTFLTVDMISNLHSDIPHWRIFYLPLLAGIFVAVAATARRLSGLSFRLAMFALALLTASFLLHMFGNEILEYLRASSSGWVHQVKIAIKQGTEVAGWFLVALSLIIGVRDHDMASRRSISYG